MSLARLALVALTVFCAGCAAPRSRSPIIPPASKKKLADIPFKVFRVREQITIAWDDCEPQPDGTTYEILDKTDWNDPWALYAETPLKFLVIPTDGEGLHVFVVRAKLNGATSNFAGKDCP